MPLSVFQEQLTVLPFANPLENKSFLSRLTSESLDDKFKLPSVTKAVDPERLSIRQTRKAHHHLLESPSYPDVSSSVNPLNLEWSSVGRLLRSERFMRRYFGPVAALR